MLSRAGLATRLRLVSGLVLMAFVASHLVNHALGIHSLQAMEDGRVVFLTVWRSWPGTLVLYGALLAHVVLVIQKLYVRRSLKMPAWEVVQIVLGLLIPFLLVVHVIGTRGAHEQLGLDDSYTFLLNLLWPGGATRQSVLLLIVWVHGCIGLHFWLRLRPWYRSAMPLLFALALLLPALSLIGFYDAARAVEAMAEADPAWLEAVAAAGNWPDAQSASWVYRTEGYVLYGFMAVLVVVLGGRVLRRLVDHFRGRVRLSYPDGTAVAVSPGTSVLDASRAAGIPHAAVCGGRGRCSTCRIRVAQGGENLAPPAVEEARVLKRIGASPTIRLACQLRPEHDLSVVPLLPPTAGPPDGRTSVNPGQGVEREIAVLFADLRAFTRLAEGLLPYDVVFILNQYFKSMGAAIESQGGRIDKFIGDGIMALFGIDDPAEEACRGALAAARAMSSELDALNRRLDADLREPLRIGIGLHVGPVILGHMGYGRATSLTAIGDTVNVASRLETLTKDHGVELVVSSRLAERAGVDLAAFEEQQIAIRGRRRPLRVRLVGDAGSLPLDATSADAAGPHARAWLASFGRALRVGRS